MCFGALLGRGVVAESRSDFEGALAFYDIAMRVNPGDSEVLKRLTKLRTALSKVPEYVLVLK